MSATPDGSAAGASSASFFDLIPEPAVRVRLIEGWRLARSEDGAALALHYHAGGELKFTPWAPDFEAANERLVEGAPLAELRDQVVADGGSARGGAYLVVLQRIARKGFFEFALTDEEGEQAVAHPLRDDFTLSLPAAPDPGDGLHPMALLRRFGAEWLLESPLSAARLRMRDVGALERPLVRRVLAGAGFLESADEARAAPQREALRQWEFHDLLFHARSRGGWHRDAFGGMFPYIGDIEPLPAVRPEWPGERIALPRAPQPTDSTDPAGGESFVSVLARRRSERVYDENRPISIADLGALFDRCLSIRGRSHVQVGNFLGRSAMFEVSRRPYPSGGASYELETYLVVDRAKGLDSGCYHYDAAAHELVRISERTPVVEQVLKEAGVATVGQANPQVVLIFAARFARVMWKYKAIAYSVILRNAGALYQTLYLAATDLGLSPCGIGSGNSVAFAQMTGLDPWVEGSVGDFILGGAPRRED